MLATKKLLVVVRQLALKTKTKTEVAMRTSQLKSTLSAIKEEPASALTTFKKLLNYTVILQEVQLEQVCLSFSSLTL
jgi:hypothetical protein